MIIRKQFPQFLAPYCIALEKSVGAIVFRVDTNKKKEYLLIKYRNGHWEFPRGKMESNESEIDTMRREIMEEAGLTHVNIVPNFRKSIHFFYATHGREKQERIAEGSCIFVQKKAIFYLVAVSHTHNVDLSHEHTDFAWLPFEKAQELLTFQNAKRVLKNAHAHTHTERTFAF